MDCEQRQILDSALGPRQRTGEQDPGARRAATSSRLGKSLRPSSAAVGNPRGCQPLSWNLLSSGQLDLCGADRPPGAVAWIGSTRLTAKPSKTSTSIRWSATRSSGYAAGPPGKQIRMKQVISARHSARHARNVESHMDRLGPALRFQVTLNHRAQYAHQNV